MIIQTELRAKSLAIAKQLGYDTNDSLPLLDFSRVTRSSNEIVDRILGMLCVAACAYGFDHQKAIEWIDREAGTDALTGAEHRFITSTEGNRQSFIAQIEAIWALAWSVGTVEKLDFGKPCAQDFVFRLPDLKGNQSSGPFRREASVRDHSEIVAACDLAYCLHWAIRDSELRRKKVPGKVQTYVVVERRKALEWLLSEEAWEDISLDT